MKKTLFILLGFILVISMMLVACKSTTTTYNYDDNGTDDYHVKAGHNYDHCSHHRARHDHCRSAHGR